MIDASHATVAGRPRSPLQVGIPGTQELFVIVFVFLLLAIPTVLVVAVVVGAVRWLGGDDDERVAELEAEVERLRDELDAVRGTDSASDRDPGDPASAEREDVDE